VHASFVVSPVICVMQFSYLVRLGVTPSPTLVRAMNSADETCTITTLYMHTDIARSDHSES
jgi:hypothetical protein